MKRTIVLLLIIALSTLVLAACGDNGKKKIEETVAAIESIGYVSDRGFTVLEKRSAINSAKALYDGLTDEQRKSVSNDADLQAALECLDTVEANYALAQSFGEKFFLRLAKQFKYPESIALQHTWFSDLGSEGRHLANYTFQFDVKNGLGIVENVYYGNAIAFMEMSDEELDQYMRGFALTGGGYIKEGETSAMDSKTGIELDSSKIMEYFRSNR